MKISHGCLGGRKPFQAQITFTIKKNKIMNRIALSLFAFIILNTLTIFAIDNVYINAIVLPASFLLTLGLAGFAAKHPNRREKQLIDKIMETLDKILR